MTGAERELLIMVAEGIRNKTRYEIAAQRAVAEAGNNFLTGFSKATTDAAAKDVEVGEGWLGRLEFLLIQVREASL